MSPGLSIPISDALSPCRYASRNIALSRLLSITLRRFLSSSWVRYLIVLMFAIGRIIAPYIPFGQSQKLSGSIVIVSCNHTKIPWQCFHISICPRLTNQITIDRATIGTMMIIASIRNRAVPIMVTQLSVAIFISQKACFGLFSTIRYGRNHIARTKMQAIIDNPAIFPAKPNRVPATPLASAATKATHHLFRLMVLFIIIMGVSRVSLEAHWPSDVLGSLLLGGLILVPGIILYRHYLKDNQTEPEVADARAS